MDLALHLTSFLVHSTVENVFLKQCYTNKYPFIFLNEVLNKNRNSSSGGIISLVTLNINILNYVILALMEGISNRQQPLLMVCKFSF